MKLKEKAYIRVLKNQEIFFDYKINTFYFNSSQETLTLKVNENIFVKILNSRINKKNKLIFLSLKKKNKKEFKKLLPLYISLINTYLKGVIQKFKINLYLKGIGFKVNKIENQLNLKLGFSHEINLFIPKNIKVLVINSNQIILYGSNWNELTQFAHNIKRYKKIEPYKGKGILLKNEKILRKEGKKNKK